MVSDTFRAHSWDWRQDNFTWLLLSPEEVDRERDDGIRSQATGDMCATFLAGNLVINSQVVLLTA